MYMYTYGIYCKSTIYFRRHNNILYLLNFNITYIIIFATCFDSYESSSGINFQELLYILFYSFMSYSFLCLSRTIAIGIPFCITRISGALPLRGQLYRCTTNVTVSTVPSTALVSLISLPEPS